MPYTIGEVARMMNIAPSTLRYYEKEGLLSLGARASNRAAKRTQNDDISNAFDHRVPEILRSSAQGDSLVPAAHPARRRDTQRPPRHPCQRARQRPRADRGAANEARTSGIQLLVLRDRAAVRFGSAAV